jgi:hypothetical protein
MTYGLQYRVARRGSDVSEGHISISVVEKEAK